MGWTADDIPSLEGCVALVTGANSGLGLESVRALAARQATVILACRSRSRAESAKTRLIEEGLSASICSTWTWPIWSVSNKPPIRSAIDTASWICCSTMRESWRPRAPSLRRVMSCSLE